MNLSPAQANFLKSFKSGRMSLACGSVRSGKTYVSFPAMNYFLIEMAEPKVPILLTAKTTYTLKNNFIIPFREFLEKEGMDKFYTWKEQPLSGFFEPKGIPFFCVGANDEGAEGKVRGSTVQGWFGDEVTLYPETFFTRCRASLSHNPQTAVLTCNPDRQSHWLKTKYIAQHMVDYYRFRLTDNPGLDPSYIEMIKKNYTGAYYTRMVEGEWGGGEDDLVIPEFGEHKGDIVVEHERPEHFHPMVSLDVGWRDFTVALFGYYDFKADLVVIEQEVVIQKQMNTDMLARMIRDTENDLWGQEAKIRYTDIDLRLIEDMQVLHQMTFIPTRKDDKNAQINNLRIMIKSHKIQIDPVCKHLVSQLENAVWNKKKTTYERTEEHGHFDALDALIYFIRNVLHTNPYPGFSKEFGRNQHRYFIPGLPEEPKLIPSMIDQFREDF